MMPWRMAHIYAASYGQLLSKDTRINERSVPYTSYSPAATRLTAPIMMGTKVCQLLHGNCAPPQVMPIKKLLALANPVEHHQPSCDRLFANAAQSTRPRSWFHSLN